MTVHVFDIPTSNNELEELVTFRIDLFRAEHVLQGLGFYERLGTFSARVIYGLMFE